MKSYRTFSDAAATSICTMIEARRSRANGRLLAEMMHHEHLVMIRLTMFGPSEQLVECTFVPLPIVISAQTETDANWSLGTARDTASTAPNRRSRFSASTMRLA